MTGDGRSRQGPGFRGMSSKDKLAGTAIFAPIGLGGRHQPRKFSMSPMDIHNMHGIQFEKRGAGYGHQTSQSPVRRGDAARPRLPPDHRAQKPSGDCRGFDYGLRPCGPGGSLRERPRLHDGSDARQKWGDHYHRGRAAGAENRAGSAGRAGAVGPIRPPGATVIDRDSAPRPS